MNILVNLVRVGRFSGLVGRVGIIFFCMSRSVSVRYMFNLSGQEMILAMEKAFSRQLDLHVVINLITKKDGDRLHPLFQSSHLFGDESDYVVAHHGTLCSVFDLRHRTR